MAKLARKMSIASRALRPQLAIAFCLMSVIPILALLNFIFPSFLPRNFFETIIITIITLSLFGFLIIKRIVDPIIKINSEIKVIASGELSHKIDIDREDEIGEISEALNQLTQNIKSNMDELKIYGERTKDINVQINKQVIALNGLLQISNLISKGMDLKDIFEATISRLAQMSSSSAVFLLSKKENGFQIVNHYGLSEDVLAAATDPTNAYLFNNLFVKKPYAKTERPVLAGNLEELPKVLKIKNILTCPVMVQGGVWGILGVGNQLYSFRYSEDDIELVNIFSKHLSIAVENDFLVRKVKELEIKDPLTGLYNRRYILSRFNEEILRAISHQKPCSFIIIKIANMQDLRLQFGEAAYESLLREIAQLLKTCLGEMDRAGRMEDDEFSVILPERNKRQAQSITSQINDKIQLAFNKEGLERRPVVNLSVVENPIDGADSSFLIQKAKELIHAEGQG
jgi:diguanylate cyclase (GGDEF)-like protein